MRIAEFGVNGDMGGCTTRGDLIALLERGGEIRRGVFSPPTGYSGWWDSYWLEGDHLVMTTDQTDTSHFDPQRVEVWEAPWPAIRALILEGPEDAEEAFARALQKAWEAGLFTLVRPAQSDMGPGWSKEASTSSSSGEEVVEA